MTADHVARAAAAHRRQFDFAGTQIDQMQIRHAAENAPGRLLGQHGKMPGGSNGMKALASGRLAFFAANPDLLEEMIEANLVVARNAGAAIGGVGERASERMARAVLRGVEMQVAMSKFDAAVGLARDVRVVRDHENGVAAAVQFAENFEDHGFVGFIEIAGGLVGHDQLRLIDQRARDGHALLLAAGKLRGQMRQAISQADALQGLRRLRLVRDAVKILREHHVFESGEIRHKMELLENETDFLGAVANELIFAEFREIDAIDDDASRSKRIQAAENIDQRCFAGAGGTHESNPFGGLDAEAERVDGAQRAVLLGQRFDDHLCLRAHPSPRNTDAGRTFASRRSGYAPAIETSMVSATATGYTIKRGRAATPKTCLHSQIDTKRPSAAPRMPPVRPRRAASARNSRRTRRVAPPMAFIKPTSFLRSMATLVMAAMTQSAVSTSTSATVADKMPLIRLDIFASPSA